MEASVLCLGGVFDSAVHIVRDVLATAARVSEANGSTSLTVSSATLDGQPVQTGSGQVYCPDVAIADSAPDVVLLPGIQVDDDLRNLESALAAPSAGRLYDGLRRWHADGAEIATACTGTWFVAEAGLLDGREATTTWSLAGPFRERYPTVRLRADKMVTLDGSIRCAGAAMAHMDLALSLVTTIFGAAISREVASLLLLDGRRSQAQYMVTEHLRGASEDFRRVDSWVRDHISESFSIAQLAAACRLSPRTLARRVREATGESPLRLVQRIRVAEAAHLLETTSLSFAEITERVGYSEPATLRRLVRRLLGRAPSELRVR